MQLAALLPVLALASAAPQQYDSYAAPTSEVISQGPWVADDAWAEVNRNPKEIAEPQPSGLSRFASFWGWDKDVVKEGIFKNENIMIHVGQNLFNFIFTTLAWFTVSQIYSLTADVNGRQQRSLTISEAADDVLEAIRAFEHKNK